MRASSSFARTANLSYLARALTILECMIATLILSVAVIGVLMPMITGHRCLRHAELHSRAVRVAENMVEEMLPRPYGVGTGASRSQWGLDQYNGLSEQAGDLRDWAGRLCDSNDQVFGRSVTVTSETQSLAGIGGPNIPGKTLTVRVDGPDGESWTLRRFIPTPTP